MNFFQEVPSRSRVFAIPRSWIAKSSQQIRNLEGNNFFYVVIGIVSAAGIFLRLIEYFRNRSLWLDEASLAANVLDRTLSRLVEPLIYEQGAPVGFLFLVKALTIIWGSSEYILRLVPLIGGILAIPLFFLLLNRLFYYRTKLAVFAGMVLISFSPRLIYFSSEFKPYSSDVFFCLLIFLLTILYFQSNKEPWITTIYALVGAISLWFSFPATFILAGVGMTLLGYALIQRNWKELARLGAIGLTWLASFTALYLISLDALGKNQALLSYWQGSFAPFPPRNFADVKWYASAFTRMFYTTMHLSLTKVAVFCFFLGVIAFFWKDRPLFFFFLTPFLFLLAASAAQKYPFEDRLLLFLVPVLILFMVRGIAFIGHIVSRNFLLNLIPLLLFFLILYSPAKDTVTNFVTPTGNEEIRPVIRYVRKNWQNGDFMFVYFWSKPAFEYYARPLWISKDQYVYDGYSHDQTGIEKELERYQGKGRVWFLFSHFSGEDVSITLSVLDKMGEYVDSVKADGAGAYLYDLK